MGRVRGEHLGPPLAAVLVVGAGQEQAGQLAVRARRRLQRHVRQPGDLRQRALQAPHQVERALGVLGVLKRVEPRVPGQGGHALVQLRVVLHRARPERVEALVQVEVLRGERGVVAHDLGLGHLGQLRGPLAHERGRQHVLHRHLGHVGLGGHEGPAPGAGALEDRDRVLVPAGVGDEIAHPHRLLLTRAPRGAHHLGQAVDVLAGPALGDGHQQPVRVLGVVAPQAVARVDPGRAGPQEEAVQVRHAHGELAHHRPGVDLLEAERLAGVVGAAQHQLGELHEAPAAQPGQVDHAGQGVQRLGRADVVRGLLPADVLLAGLEREHEAAPPVHVLGLARDPTGHPPDEPLGGGEEPEARAAVVQPVAERLALAHADVGAHLARRLEDAQRKRVRGAHEQRPGALARLGQLAHVLHGAQEVRLLDEHGGGVVVHRGGQGGRVGGAGVVQRDLHHLHAVSRGVRAQRGAGVRVKAAAGHEPGPARLQLRQVPRGGHGARALVHRRVGHGQPGELRDGRLELEHDLEAALGDLGLVGRVGREELGPAGERVHQRGHVVVVHARPEEAGLGVGVPVARRQRRHLLVHLLLREPGGQVDVPPEPDAGRDVGEEVLERVGADGAEHRRQVLVGDGGVAGHQPPDCSRSR